MFPVRGSVEVLLFASIAPGLALLVSRSVEEAGFKVGPAAARVFAPALGPTLESVPRFDPTPGTTIPPLPPPAVVVLVTDPLPLPLVVVDVVVFA